MADESAPMGQLTEDQRQRAAEAEEIAEIRRRHDALEPHRGHLDDDTRAAHADRARLRTLLDEALLREATLRADLREARGLLRRWERHGDGMKGELLRLHDAAGAEDQRRIEAVLRGPAEGEEA